MTKPTELRDLLLEAFPDVVDRFPADCWLVRVVESTFQLWIEAVAALDAPGRGATVARIRAAHPPNRRHLDDHDGGVQRVFTEVEAFAWTRLAGLGSPQFVDGEGAPDLYVPEYGWVEAKTVQTSDADRAAWDLARAQKGSDLIVSRIGSVGDVADSVVRKFESDFQDAVGKPRRPNGEPLVVFYCLELDLEADETDVLRALEEWASTVERRSDVKIVIAQNHRWDRPVWSTV